MTSAATALATTNQLTKLLDRATAEGAHEAQVTSQQSELFEINFDRDDISLVRTTFNQNTTLALYADGRKGTARFNGSDEAATQQALDNASAAMRAAVADPAAGIAASDPAPAVALGDSEPDRATMGEAVLHFQATLKERWPDVLPENCHYVFCKSTTTFANTLGVTREERRNFYSLAIMMTGKRQKETTSFNYTGQSSLAPFEDLALPSVQRILDDTSRSFGARSIPHSFTGTLIFTPESLGDLLGAVIGALSGYEMDAGTTPYKDSQGQRIASELLTVLNQPRHTDFPQGSFFDGWGLPTQDLPLIAHGILENFCIDYYSSRKLNRPATAGALNLVVLPGETPLAEIIRSTRQGIVMGRFSGGRPNQNLDFSGIAKNSFYLENGEIRHPLAETMVSGNFGELIRNISAISPESVNDGSGVSPWVACEGARVAAG